MALNFEPHERQFHSAALLRAKPRGARSRSFLPLGLTLVFFGTAGCLGSTGCIRVLSDIASDPDSRADASPSSDGGADLVAGDAQDAPRDFQSDTLGTGLVLDALIVRNSASSAEFSGTCVLGTRIRVNGVDSAEIPCDGGRFTYTAAAQTSDGERVYHFETAGVLVGSSDQVDARWRRDTTGPTLVVGRMTLNEGAKTAANPLVRVSLEGHDALSPITDICLKWTDTVAPSAGDPCWEPLAGLPAARQEDTNLTLTAHPFFVGFIPGSYSIAAFLRDDLGNISILSLSGKGTLGEDRQEIDFDPGEPPSVVDILATGVSVPSDPPTQADLSAPQGRTVFVKWRARDEVGLTATPIDISVTQDDLTYQPVASGLVNGANGSCVIDDPATQADDGATGCFTWSGGSPSSGYFRIRVRARASDNEVGSATSAPLNTPNVRFLAGQTDPGTGSSARAAMFINMINPSKDYGDPGNLAVTRSGTVYFRDIGRGILSVDRRDGVQRVLIPTTGAATGDGGPITAATLRLPRRIALDFQERLLVFDFDRIRRIDLRQSPPTIETVIGGGSSSADGVNPLDVEIKQTDTRYEFRDVLGMPFMVLPNGDIYFISDNFPGITSGGGTRIRVYRAAAGRVASIRPSGVADGITTGQDLTECSLSQFSLSFDPLTSAIRRAQITTHSATATMPTCATSAEQRTTVVSLDPLLWRAQAPHPPRLFFYMNYVSPVQAMTGEAYFFSRREARILRLNEQSLVMETVVGTGELGQCSDGTPALSCAIDPQDAFVSANNELFFMDRGRLRILDRDSKVRTIMGRTRAAGDGGRPQDARFGFVNRVHPWHQGATRKIVVMDRAEARIREFSTSAITTLAGNGSHDPFLSGGVAVEHGLHIARGGQEFAYSAVSPAGDLFFSRGAVAIARLDRSSGRWVDIAGGGTVDYFAAAAEGKGGTEINFSPALFRANYSMNPLGYAANRLLVSRSGWDGTQIVQSRFFALDSPTIQGATTYHQVAGAATGSEFCADGIPLTACSVPVGFEMLAASYDALRDRWLVARRGGLEVKTLTSAGTLQTLAILPRRVGSFGYDAVNDRIFYCSVSNSTLGRLYRRDVASGAEQELPLPAATIRCAGDALTYDSQTQTLIFGFTQNGLGGVAEYILR